MILEEGNQPYPMCLHCDMFVSHKVLNGRHLTTDLCIWGAERKRRRLAREEAQAGADADFTAYETPLTLINAFGYLGRVLLTDNGDCPAVVHNLWKAQWKWARLT